MRTPTKERATEEAVALSAAPSKQAVAFCLRGMAAKWRPRSLEFSCEGGRFCLARGILPRATMNVDSFRFTQ